MTRISQIALSLCAALATSACGGRDAPDAFLDGHAPHLMGAIVDGRAAGSDEAASSVALLFATAESGAPPASAFVDTFCSGVLIAPDVVLTAAHCVDGFSEIADAIAAELPDFSTRFMVSGQASPTPTLPSDAIEVADAVVHPAYNGEDNRLADVALLFLAQPSTRPTSFVLQPAESAHLFVGKNITIVGWGVRDPERDESSVKQLGEAQLGFVGANTIASGVSLDGSTTSFVCSGDSGGPTFVRARDRGVVVERVAGVTARGGADCRTFSTSTRVDVHFAFLDDEMRAACSRGARVSCAEPGLAAPTPLAAPLVPALPPLYDAARDAAAAICASAISCDRLPADDSEDCTARVLFLFAPDLGDGCDDDVVTAFEALGACLANEQCGGSSAACEDEAAAVDDAAATCTGPLVVVDEERTVTPERLTSGADGEDDRAHDDDRFSCQATGDGAFTSLSGASLASLATSLVRRRRQPRAR